MNEEMEQLTRDMHVKVLALQAALHAIIALHPMPKELGILLTAFEEAGLATMLGCGYSDQQISEYQATIQRLRLQMRPAQEQTPR